MLLLNFQQNGQADDLLWVVVQILKKNVWITIVCVLFYIIVYVGWGPHAYFQMLAESRNGSQPSTVNNEIHHVQSSELQAVSVYIPPQHDADTRVNSWDSSPMLGASQNVRTH